VESADYHSKQVGSPATAARAAYRTASTLTALAREIYDKEGMPVINTFESSTEPAGISIAEKLSAARLIEARENCGLTLKEVAIELEVTVDYWAKCEAGLAQPDLSEGLWAAAFLGVDPDWLAAIDNSEVVKMPATKWLVIETGAEVATFREGLLICQSVKADPWKLAFGNVEKPKPAARMA
jgi:transcriptional regulator with XRE-family HTH domain